MPCKVLTFFITLYNVNPGKLNTTQNVLYFSALMHGWLLIRMDLNKYVSAWHTVIWNEILLVVSVGLHPCRGIPNSVFTAWVGSFMVGEPLFGGTLMLTFFFFIFFKNAPLKISLSLGRKYILISPSHDVCKENKICKASWISVVPLS